MVKKFEYKFPFDQNFRDRHAVDYHNNLRHTVTLIEDTWVTDRWECCVFYFNLGISEVNAFLILRYFLYYGLRWEVMPTLLKFHWKLAWKLINNIYIG